MISEIISVGTQYKNPMKQLFGGIPEILLDVERISIRQALKQKPDQDVSFIQCYLQTELES